MTDAPPDPPELEPAQLAGASFSRVRKGFAPTEVHSLLGRAADALRVWNERDERLLERIAELERQLSEAAELDEQRITTVLGEETARIVKAARDAASEIRAKAEADASRLLAEAQQAAATLREAAEVEAAALRDAAGREHEAAVAEASQLRAAATEDAQALRREAEEEAARLRQEAQALHDDLMSRAGAVLEERTTEAEAVAAGIREAADAELATARTEGERIRAEAREAAAEEVERARQEGREMVAEARRVRERMLRDLAERRRSVRRQIEGARAGRDRIVEALRAVADTLEDTLAELARVDDEAARAADLAAAAVADDLDHVVADLETGLNVGSFETALAEVTPIQAATGSGSPGDDSRKGPASSEDLDGREEDAGPEDLIGPDESGEAEPVEGSEEVAEADQAPGVGEVAEAEEQSPGATVHDLFERIRAERSAAREFPPSAEAQTAAEATATAVATALRPEEEPPAAAGEPAPVGAEPDRTTEELDPVTVLLDRRDQLLGPAEKALARSLKRLVSDEQNQVLDRLRRIRRGRPDLDELLPAGDQVDSVVEMLCDDFAAAVAAGSAFWNEVAGVEGTGSAGTDGPYPQLRAQVEALLANHRAHLQRVLDDADAAGLEVSEVAAHVRAAYREWRSTSIPEFAGDLATAGFAEGARRAAGPDGRWCWVQDHGGLPCSDAEDNALAGEVPVGSPFPTGDPLPPAHSGCRCILVPPRR